MQLKSLALIGLVGGIGWMWLKGLHLDDIQQILVKAGSHTSQSADPTNPYSTGNWHPTPTSNSGQANPGAMPPGTIPLPPANPRPDGTLRIASFNIQVFGDAKASKPHVYDTLAQIVALFDVVAIQEIRTKDEFFMQKFVQRINELAPGRQFDCRVGPRLGRTQSKEQYAFVFDTARVLVHPRMVYTLPDENDLLHREPLVAMFMARGPPADQAFTFILVNVHTDPDEAREEMDVLAQVYSLVRRNSGGEDDILMLGDFNTNVPNSRPLSRSDLGRLGEIPNIYPVIQNEPTNIIRTKLHDNILFHSLSTTEYKLRGGVYDFPRQLASMGVSLEQAKEVSDHLPVWADFSIYESGSPGYMASGQAGAPR